MHVRQWHAFQERYILARLCAPKVGEDEWQQTKWESLPSHWPLHLDKAIRILNWRPLPALKHSPKELLLGIVANSPKATVEEIHERASNLDTEIHMAYAAQQRLDGYAKAVKHAQQRKSAFDRKVLRSKDGLVNFKAGDLVQIHRSELEHTLASHAKLAPQWSEPYRVTEASPNACKLETIEGHTLEGKFQFRRYQYRRSPRSTSPPGKAGCRLGHPQNSEGQFSNCPRGAGR